MLNTTWKLSLAVVATAALGVLSASANAQGLQAYWTFENPIGGVSTDLQAGLTAEPNAGTGATYSSDNPSPIGGQVTGSSSASLPDELDSFRVNEAFTGLDGSNTFTMQAWVKPTDIDTDAGDRNMFVTKDGAFEWGTQGGVFMMRVNNNDRNLGTTDVTNALLDGEWHHVGVVYENLGGNSIVNYYVDGNLWETVNGAGLGETVGANGNAMGFGNRPDDTGTETDQGYQGLIDEVAIFTGLLDATDMNLLATGQNNPSNIPEPSSFILAGLGILGMAFAARRRRVRGQKS
jgi:hypothetical protein